MRVNKKIKMRGFSFHQYPLTVNSVIPVCNTLNKQKISQETYYQKNYVR